MLRFYSKKKNRGTSTDFKGKFTFDNLSYGVYKLRISHVGYSTKTLEIKLNKPKLDLNIVLDYQIDNLQEIEIIGRKEKGYKNSNSFVGTKSETALKDVPQSVGYVTKEVILDQGAFRLNDVVKNVSGVNQHTFYNDLTIRGFRVLGQRNFGTLINGMRQMTSFWSQQLIPHLEKVEIIKGPASALFGNASPGGTVNKVTKKPLTNAKKSISTSVGSFNTFRLLADFTGPMTDDEKLLYRLNIGYENSDGFRDLQFDKNLIIAPSFSFLPSDKTRLNVDVVYQNSDGRLDRGQSVFGNGDLYSVPITKSLSAMNDYLKETNLNVTLSFQHKFSKNFSFNSIYMLSSYDEDLLEHRNANSFVSLGDGNFDITKVAMRVFIRKRSWDNNSYSNYINWNYQISDVIKNKLLVGYDYFKQELEAGGAQQEAKAYLLKNGSATNTFKRDKIDSYVTDTKGNPVANVPFFDLKDPYINRLRDMSKYVYSTRNFGQYLQENQGFYIQNQLSIADKIDVLLAVRKDYFTDYIDYKTEKEKKVKQDAFLPRAGVVFKASKNINIYSTWVKGYQPQIATAISNPNAGGPFEPLNSELFEIGAKAEWFNKKLSTTLALYNLTQKGTLYDANDPTNPDKKIQTGEDKSKGIELSAYGRIMSNWNIILNYAYNNAYISKADDKTLKLFGDRKPNAPKHTFNIWSKYVLNKGVLKGLGFGFGYDYVSERLGSIIKNPKLLPIFPSYGLVNMAIYYQVNKFQIQLNFNNIFNKTHWVGGYDFLRAFPGKPRNVMTTVSYTF